MVVTGPELAGGVRLHHPGDLGLAHPAPVVPHTQPGQALLLQPHFDVGGGRVQRVLDQLLDGAPDTGHHLAALQEADGVLGQRSQAAHPAEIWKPGDLTEVELNKTIRVYF